MGMALISRNTGLALQPVVDIRFQQCDTAGIFIRIVPMKFTPVAEDPVRRRIAETLVIPLRRFLEQGPCPVGLHGKHYRFRLLPDIAACEYSTVR